MTQELITEALTLLEASRNSLWEALIFEQKHQNKVLAARRSVRQTFKDLTWKQRVLSTRALVTAFVRVEGYYLIVASSRSLHFADLARQAQQLVKHSLSVKKLIDNLPVCPEDAQNAMPCVEQCAKFALCSLTNLAQLPFGMSQGCKTWDNCEKIAALNIGKLRLHSHRKSYRLI